MAFDNNVDNANDGQQLAIKWLWWWFKNDNDIADDTRNALMMHSTITVMIIMIGILVIDSKIMITSWLW